MTDPERFLWNNKGRRKKRQRSEATALTDPPGNHRCPFVHLLYLYNGSSENLLYFSGWKGSCRTQQSGMYRLFDSFSRSIKEQSNTRKPSNFMMNFTRYLIFDGNDPCHIRKIQGPAGVSYGVSKSTCSFFLINRHTWNLQEDSRTCWFITNQLRFGASFVV